MTEFFDHNWTRWPSFARDYRNNWFNKRTTVKFRRTWNKELVIRVVKFRHIRELAFSIRVLNNLSASWYLISEDIVFVDLVRILANSLIVYSWITLGFLNKTIKRKRIENKNQHWTVRSTKLNVLWYFHHQVIHEFDYL